MMHVRSHTDLPRFITKCNRRADALATPVQLAGLPDIFQQAKLSHQQFHQNIPGLVCQFHLRQNEAKAIVATCPSCQKLAVLSLGSGVNPKGLGSWELWQTDVTCMLQLGRVKYVCVSLCFLWSCLCLCPYRRADHRCTKTSVAGLLCVGNPKGH